MKGFFKQSPQHKDKQEGDICHVLKGMPIFQQLTRRELTAVARILHERVYQPEEIIFRENEPGMGMYIIESGNVIILSEAAKMQLSELNAGGFFGEMSLLDAAPRSATAKARTECRIFGFFQPDLFGLIERNPQLGIKIVLGLSRLICERLRQTNQRAYEFNEALQQMKQSQK